MKIQTYDVGTWLYPDSKITSLENSIVLDSAKNADVCFQILTNLKCSKGTSIDWSLDTQDDGISVVVHELRPVLVQSNSSAKLLEATNWEEAKDFAVRQAPYEVYDLTRPIDDGKLWGETGYTAFFIRVNVAKDVTMGNKKLVLNLKIAEKEAAILINLNVHNAILSNVEDSPFAMGFWLFKKTLKVCHNAERFTDKFYEYAELYLKQMKEMRCNHIQIPTPEPIYNEDGKIVDFDFTECDRITEIALKLGFRYINSGFVAKFLHWRDSEYRLIWDLDTLVESPEGYRQLLLYITKTKEYINRHNIQNKYWQSLVDEPQVTNSVAYKALSLTFRKEMPDYLIIDPVETPNIAGACDVWIIKQATYEMYKEQFDELRNRGEKFWIYTCGFPAGKWMNQAIDLPLAATRLIPWQAVRYGMVGFADFGYMEYADYSNPMYHTTLKIPYKGETRYYPPGNAAVVYTDGNMIYDSVRAHVHRISAEEAELLMKLREYDEFACNKIIDSVSTTFEEYVSDSAKIEFARKMLFEKLDNCADKDSM